jgi:hypothetical protein
VTKGTDLEATRNEVSQLSEIKKIKQSDEKRKYNGIIGKTKYIRYCEIRFGQLSASLTQKATFCAMPQQGENVPKLSSIIFKRYAFPIYSFTDMKEQET